VLGPSPREDALVRELAETKTQLAVLHAKLSDPQRPNAEDLKDKNIPAIVQLIESIVPVKDTGRNGERLFSVQKGRALLCADNPEYYRSGRTFGTTTIGYVERDGTFVPSYPEKSPVLIIFLPDHTEDNPSYQVYDTKNSLSGGRYIKAGEYRAGTYEMETNCERFKPGDFLPK
jgi:hypothetical protein